MRPIEIGPGVLYTATKDSYSSAWREANLMRWSGSKLLPVGWWEKFNFPAFASRCRAVHNWSDNAGIKYTAYLCEAHLYIDISGTLFDATPADGIVSPASDVIAGGYGEWNYDEGDYGTPRPNVNRQRAIAPCYKLGNWGQTLLAMSSVDGRLLRWDPTVVPSAKAAAVTGAPISNRTFVVTADRFVILYGKSGDRRKWGWCDQENIQNWNIADLESKAGEYDVEPASPLVAAVLVSDGVLYFSAAKAYLARFVGNPYVYSYEEVGDSVTPISAASLVNAGGKAIWPSEAGFWAYEAGGVVAIECPVWNWVLENIDNVYARFEACGIVNAPKSEYWWFFPSKGSTKNDRYVMFNYRERWWSMGRLSRTAGYSSHYDSFPVMVDDRIAYKHESGQGYPGAPELPWIETFNLNMGERELTVDQMVPSIQGNADAVRFCFFKRDNRSRQQEIKTPYKKVRTDGYMDIRETGRDFRLRIELTAAVTVTFGQSLISTVKRGGR